MREKESVLCFVYVFASAKLAKLSTAFMMIEAFGDDGGDHLLLDLGWSSRSLPHVMGRAQEEATDDSIQTPNAHIDEGEDSTDIIVVGEGANHHKQTACSDSWYSDSH